MVRPLEDQPSFSLAASQSLPPALEIAPTSQASQEAFIGPKQFVSLSLTPAAATITTPIVTVSDGEVLFLGAGVHPSELQIDVPNNVNAADTTNTDVLQPGGSSGLNLTGQGYTVGVWEAGGVVRATHQEFGSRVTVLDGAGVTDHATHVAGTIGASGVNAAALGMASQVGIRSRDSANDSSEMDADANLFQVSNHSYSFISGWSTRDTSIVGLSIGNADIWFEDRAVQSGEDSAFGQYGSAARDLDTVINNHPHILSVWSAGNDRNDGFTNARGDDTYVTFLSADPGNVTGYSGPGYYLVPNSGPTVAPGTDGNNGTGYDSIPNSEQTAKNNLTVGAVNDVTVDPVSGVVTTSFSSYGPVDDGRVKPDIAGNGASLVSSVGGSDTSYSSFSGTSMSSPNVAGSAILLTEHYDNLYGALPASATTKGAIIHTAYDAGNIGPDYAYGWGLMDAAAAADFFTTAQAGSGDDLLFETTYLGSELTETIQVGSGPLKATIVWNDPASTLLSSGLDDPSPKLVNDLDLWITDAASNVYRPWTLDPLNPATAAVRTTANHLDNVEQVLIDAPAPGTYTIHVGATGGVSNQAFSLLVSGATPAPAGDLIGVDFDSSGTLPTNWTIYNSVGSGLLSNLIDESGTASAVDLDVAVAGVATGISVFSPQAAELPQHAQPLTGLDGNLFNNTAITLTFQELVANSTYEVYLFGADSVANTQNVTITGANSVNFTQAYAGHQLFVNDAVGDSGQTLESFAEQITANGSGEIQIVVTASGSFASVAGVAIRPLGSQSGSIDGVKWNDLDGDGVKDAGEPGLANWTIYLDQNDNGVLDIGEASTVTDANGAYSFVDLPAGDYTVAEVQQTGWEQTFPAVSGGGSFQLLSGTGSGGVNEFSLVELQTDPVAEVLVGATSYSPGLDVDPTSGLLYGASSSLRIIDPADGSSTTVGSIDSASETAILMRSIAFAPDGTLYGLSVTGQTLYTINKSTAFATAVGVVPGFAWGIDFAPDGTLYSAFTSLVTLDPASGQVLSTIGVLGATVVDIDFAPNGLIYAVYYATSQLFEIDPATAATTALGTYQSATWGLASYSSGSQFQQPWLPDSEATQADVQSWIQDEQTLKASLLASANAATSVADQTDYVFTSVDSQVADEHGSDEYAAAVRNYLPPQHRVIPPPLSGTLNAGIVGPADSLDVAVSYLRQNAESLGLTSADLDSYEVADRYSSDHNGVTHIYLRQTLNDLPIVNADININILPDGRVLNAGSSFVAGLDPLAAPDAVPDLSAGTALVALANELGWSLGVTPQTLDSDGDVAQTTLLSASGISLDDIPARLQYVPTSGGGVELGWSLVVRTTEGQHWYDASVDATSGELLYLSDWIDDAQYNVFALPLEDPDDGARSLQVDPANNVASPFGWHDTDGVGNAEFTDTRGNNVFAQEDRNATDNGLGARPDGGAGLDFNFGLDLGLAPVTYQDAAISNLFYWNNVLHDIHYQYGFDEASGNFQVNNYGNGGLGNDPVQADAQYGADDSQFNNAFFGTPPDGSQPQMLMLEFNITSPNRDGDFANSIIVHEYGHGVSNRVTGGPASANALDALQSGGMGEGWGDFWGLMLAQKASDVQSGANPTGTYVLGESPNGAGIRRFPYSFDMGVNPLTYDDFNGGFPNNEVHNSGEIWASALWDMNWLLINSHGFDPDLYNGSGGNNLAMQLVMDGLKLQPANPSFLDGRDAILLADQVNNSGANQLAIWTAFARRGMGFSADDGGNANATVVVAAFDLPASSQGVVEFDDTSYAIGDTVQVQVRDSDLAGGGPFSITVASSGGDSESVLLTESGSGIFTGTVVTAAGNSQLDVQDGDVLTATYNDANDGSGSAAVVTDTADIVSGSTATPGNGVWHVSLVGGENVTGIDFGNHELPTQEGSIHGLKWNDLNGDGVRDAGEPGLAGVTIYLDQNNDGQLDTGEASTLTMADDLGTSGVDETGMYWFNDVPAGTHIVREVVPGGFEQTYPVGGQPDLIVSDLQVTAFDTNSISYSYEISNVGTGTVTLDGPGVGDEVAVQAVLSSDTIFGNGDDIPAGGEVVGGGVLLPGNSLSGSFGATVTVNTSTHPYLILRVDISDVAPESDETNNDLATLIEVSAFQIDVVFTDNNLTSVQQAVFADAAARWSEIITGDLPDVGAIDDVRIEASAPAIDGPGGILGQAGPTALRAGSNLPYAGIMEFDSADVAALETAGQLDEVILHEMAHVLGLGTIWDLRGLLDSTAANPRFLGAGATAEYNTLFSVSEASVPVENDGGPGTALGHWEEDDLRNGLGVSFNNELMTGFLNGGSNPISRVTVAQFGDLGYQVDLNAADPFTPSLVAYSSDQDKQQLGGRILALTIEEAQAARASVLEVEVVDNTNLVRDEALRDLWMTETRSWTLQVNAAGGGSSLFGLQPGTNLIVEIDSTTGNVLNSFAPPVAINTDVSGLSGAEGGSTLIFQDGADSTGNVYRVDPATGVLLSTEMLGIGSAINNRGGLSFQDDGTTDFLFAINNGGPVERQTGFSGPLANFVSVGPSFPGALGGDDHGRHFVATGSGIEEFNPQTGALLGSFAAPSSNVTGLAFDGTNLFASNTAGQLFTLNPDTGAVLDTVTVAGGALVGLGVAGVPASSKTPGDGFWTVDLAPGGLVEDVDFGNHELPVADIGDTLVAAELTPVGPGDGNYVNSTAIGDGVHGLKDVDIYEFYAALGSTVTLTTSLPAGGTGMDTILRLFDSAGNQLAINDDTSGLYSQIVHTFTAAGTYYVGVSGYDNIVYDPETAGSGIDGSIGDYLLTLDLSLGDTTSPTVTLTAPAFTNDTTPSVTVTATDAGSGVPDGTAVVLDVDLNNDGDFADAGEAGYSAATLTDGSVTFDVSPALAEGTYGLRARVSDPAGNEGSSAVSAMVVDTTNPAVTLTTPASTADTTPSVTVAATDNGSGVPDGTAVVLDVDLNNDGDFADANEIGYSAGTLNSGSATFDVSPALAVGTYPMQARVSDQAGNVGTSAVSTTEIVVGFTIDVELVPVAVPTTDNSAALPAALGQSPVGAEYYVEIWVQNIGSPANGISGGRLDVNYSTALVDSATADIVNMDFDFGTSGTVNDVAGLVDEIGGGTLVTTRGISPDWARLAYFKVTATGPGTADFSLAQGDLTFSIAGVGNVPWAAVDLSDIATVVQVPAAQLDLAVVRTPTTTDANGESATLPASEAWVHEWEPYYVEVWASTPSVTTSDVVGVLLDLSYNTALTTATQIEYGVAFTQSQTGTINDATGAITGLGAATPTVDLGDDAFVLVARVLFEPTGTDQAAVDEVNHVIGPYDLNFSTANGQVDTGSGLLSATSGPDPATDMFAVVYDIDDNNQVDFGDLAFFAPSFGLTVGPAEPPHTWWADFDKSGQVDFGDLAFFSPNFGKARPSADIVFPGNFPAASSSQSNSNSPSSSQNGSEVQTTAGPATIEPLPAEGEDAPMPSSATPIRAEILSVPTSEPSRAPAVQGGPQQRALSSNTEPVRLHAASVEAVFAEESSQIGDRASLRKRTHSVGREDNPIEIDEDLLDNLTNGNWPAGL